MCFSHLRGYHSKHNPEGFCPHFLLFQLNPEMWFKVLRRTNDLSLLQTILLIIFFSTSFVLNAMWPRAWNWPRKQLMSHSAMVLVECKTHKTQVGNWVHMFCGSLGDQQRHVTGQDINFKYLGDSRKHHKKRKNSLRPGSEPTSEYKIRGCLQHPTPCRWQKQPPLWGRKVVSPVRSTDCSCRRPDFDSQHPGGGSQLS